MALRDFRAVFLPYCLDRQQDGRYAVLNREYKPVGFYTYKTVTYTNYPVLVKLKGLTKNKAAKLSYKGENNLNHIILYDDGTNPINSNANMRSYRAKLEILAKLPIV